MGAVAKERRQFRKRKRAAKRHKKWADQLRQIDDNPDETAAVLSRSQNIAYDDTPQGGGYSDQGDMNMQDDMQDQGNMNNWEDAECADYAEDAEYWQQDWENAEDAEYLEYAEVDKFGRGVDNVGKLGNMFGGFYNQFSGGSQDWENAEYADLKESGAKGAKIVTPADSSHPDSIHHPINKLLMGLGVAIIAYWLIEKM